MLTSGGTTYIYGTERLDASVGGATTWYGGDALGSVRQTLSNASVVQSTINDDPWGQVQSGTVPTFGFTGEPQDGNLVNLRARWYNASRGAFTARDPFAGEVGQPYSLNPYQYGYANPALLTDPTGRDPWWQRDPNDPSPARPSPADVPVAPPTGTPTPPRQRIPTQYIWDDVAQVYNECAAGAFKQWALNTTLGAAHDAGANSGESVTMWVCRRGGDAVSIGQGGAEFFGGGSVAVGGVVSCGAGVTCLVGGPAAVGGAVVASHGAGVAASGTWQLVGAVTNAVVAACTASGGGGGGGGNNPAPTPGPTPAATPGPGSGTGYDVQGQLKTIWDNPRYFKNWLDTQSKPRMSNPLNQIEARQVYNNAVRHNIPYDINPKGMQGLERTGDWAWIRHFKVGSSHLPVEPGVTLP